MILASVCIAAVVAGCKTPSRPTDSELAATGAGGGWGACNDVTKESRPRASERRVEALERLLSIKEFLLKQEASAAVLVTEEAVKRGVDASEVAKAAGIPDPGSPEGERFSERAAKGELVRDPATGQYKEARTVAKEGAVRLTFGSRLADAISVAQDYVEQGGKADVAAKSLRNMEATLAQRASAPDAFFQEVHGGKIRLQAALAAMDPVSMPETKLRTTIDVTMNEYYKAAGANRAEAAENIARYLVEAETNLRVAKKTAIADALYAKAETATGGNIVLLNNYRLRAFEGAVFEAMRNGNAARSAIAADAMDAFVRKTSSAGATEVATEFKQLRDILQRAGTSEALRKESYENARKTMERMRTRLETRPEFKPRVRRG